MSMTKKDYENVALVLLSENLPGGTRVSLVKKFSEVFGKENAHFKPEVFATACGVYNCMMKGCDFQTTDIAESKAHIIEHVNNS